MTLTHPNPRDTSVSNVGLSNCLTPQHSAATLAAMARGTRAAAGRVEPDEAPREGLRLGRLEALLGYQLRRAQIATFQSFAEAMAPFGLSPGQLGVLLLVEANPGLNQTALGRA